MEATSSGSATSLTLGAHLAIHDFVTRELDRTYSAGVAIIAVELSKAFDRLSHESLVNSFSNLIARLPNGFLLWLRNFLSDHSHQVNCQGTLSSDTKRVTLLVVLLSCKST